MQRYERAQSHTASHRRTLMLTDLAQALAQAATKEHLLIHIQHVQRVAIPEALMLACSDGVLVQSESRMDVEVDGAASTASHWSHGGIREWCRSQDILAVIGRYVVLDGRGVGSCPFKEHHHRGDLRPSFQVFGGNDPHWCYTWRRASDLFDFLCLYYQLTPQEARRRLQQGGLW